MADPADVSKLKVADFGLSAKTQHMGFETSSELYGTILFMGPECLLKSVYSKPIDVFATGIIMHMLLTGGKHPLYDSPHFNFETYRQNMLKLSKLSFPENLSKLAASMFHGLTAFKLSSRYSATRALEHPWITRLNKTTIPSTLDERIGQVALESNLRTKFGVMLFLAKLT